MKTLERPADLSEWVHIEPDELCFMWHHSESFSQYQKNVRVHGRPIIKIAVRARGKYRYFLELDLYEGFTTPHERMFGKYRM